jgi:hypothetical protein
MKTRDASNEEGNGKGGKGDGDGKKGAMARRTVMVFFHPLFFDSFVNQVQSSYLL